MPRLLLLSVFLLTFAVSFGQTHQETAFVRIIVKDLLTQEDEITIDTWMRSQPAVTMSRSDHNTQIYFAHYFVDSGLSAESFEAWLVSLGYEAACSVSGLNGEPIPAFPKSCFGTRDIQEEHMEIKQ